MSSSDEIICKPTKWFLWRAVAMAVMFGIGAFMFFKDWKWGYPEKNVERYHYQAFEQAEKDFKKHKEAGKSAQEWEDFARMQKVFVSADKEDDQEDVAATVPADTDLETPWAEVLIGYEGYAKLFESEEQFNIPPGWKEFSNSDGRQWSEKSDELKSVREIRQQGQIAVLCCVLFLGAVLFFLRTMGRAMRVSGEGYTPPGGKLIPFGQIKRIDARKWDTKGLAYLVYEQDGAEKKTKVDGMVYGQFKKEEGEPAQKLYEQILANFHGELIELAPDEESEEPASEKASEKAAITNDNED